MSRSDAPSHRPLPAFRNLDYEAEPGRRSAAKLLSKAEARRIAANLAKLPEQLQINKEETRNERPSNWETAF
jgi:hypothetical protein